MGNNILKRDHFSSKFGVIAAAAGSAVGLGNIWKFPYVAGNNGGAAFLIVYLLFTFGIGLPLMISEFMIGRRSESNVRGAFKRLAPKTGWGIVGFMGVGAAFLILSFYSVAAGWSFEYIFKSLSGAYMDKSAGEIAQMFDAFATSPMKPVIWLLVFMSLTAVIVLSGVKDGIERYAKVLMPVLFLIIIVLAIRSVTLPGAREGIEFLFKPDFSKLDGSAILAALGQAFFSLSLGMGALITYGSYISKKEKLSTTAVQVTIADTSVAILAGVAIFPAVFAFGISPAEGPGLVYKTLPVVFQQMPAGILFGFLFFTLLLVAALTSSISVLEVVVAYFVEELKMHRRNATIMAAALITIFGILCSLSLGVLEIEFFDIFDFIASNILLPLGGLLISLFIGFYLEEKMVHEELSNKGKLRVPMFKFFIIVMRYIAPVAIGAVFLNEIGLFQLISKLF